MPTKNRMPSPLGDFLSAARQRAAAPAPPPTPEQQVETQFPCHCVSGCICNYCLAKQIALLQVQVNTVQSNAVEVGSNATLSSLVFTG